MQKKLKRIISALLILVVFLSLMPAIDSKAANSGYVTPTVTYRLAGDTLYIEGFGEIPDYIGTDAFNRPWHNFSYSRLSIGEYITRVGEYAFAYHAALKNVDMWSTTFLANRTCFESTDPDCIYRIHGEAPAYKMLGNINYNSWQSISVGAVKGKESIFVLDNDIVANRFRSIRYPYYGYVYSATADDNPWDSRVRYFGEDVFKKVCQLETPVGLEATISFAKEPESETFMNTIGIFTQLSNYTYLESYKCYYFENTKALFTPSTLTRRYVLNLDETFQIANANYKLLQICPDHTLRVYEDLDLSPKTFTFSTNYASGSYFLVY